MADELVANLALGEHHASDAETPQVRLLRLGVGARHDLEPGVAVERVNDRLTHRKRVGDGDDHRVGVRHVRVVEH